MGAPAQGFSRRACVRQEAVREAHQRTLERPRTVGRKCAKGFSRPLGRHPQARASATGTRERPSTRRRPFATGCTRALARQEAVRDAHQRTHERPSTVWRKCAKGFSRPLGRHNQARASTVWRTCAKGSSRPLGRHNQTRASATATLERTSACVPFLLSLLWACDARLWPVAEAQERRLISGAMYPLRSMQPNIAPFDIWHSPFCILPFAPCPHATDN